MRRTATHTDGLVRAGDTGVSMDVIGEKADRLMALYEIAARSRFEVPRFCVLPASALSDFHRQRGWTPDLRYPALPVPDCVPPDTAEGFAEFGRDNRAAIQDCLTQLTMPAMLRTSLRWPANAVSSGCGVNATILLTRRETDAIVAGPALPSLLSLLYKAYTTWDLDPARRWRSRAAGIVFMDGVPFSALGTAYLENGRLTIEADGKRPARRARYVLREDAEDTVPANGPLSAAWRRALADACADVRAACPDAGLLEVEFGFAMDDDTLFLVQMRAFPGETTPAAVFHSIGSVEGELVDLRRTPRGRGALDVARYRDCVLVLHARDSARCDAFALAWVDGCRPRGVLLDHGEAMPAGAGFRNHTARLLREKFPDLFVAQVNAGPRPAAPGHVRAWSDGVELRISAGRG